MPTTVFCRLLGAFQAEPLRHIVSTPIALILLGTTLLSIATALYALQATSPSHQPSTVTPNTQMKTRSPAHSVTGHFFVIEGLRQQPVKSEHSDEPAKTPTL